MRFFLFQLGASMQEPDIDSQLVRGVGPLTWKFNLGIKNFEKYSQDSFIASRLCKSNTSLNKFPV